MKFEPAEFTANAALRRIARDINAMLSPFFCSPVITPRTP
ncbi:hypothetical protein EDP1_2328 [Pseudomonas putida S610]|nr:hypothetical protein EDP1_2328 [Pseudomonas putida S610]